MHGGTGESARPRRLISVVISVVAVTGAVAGTVLATTGARPSAADGAARTSGVSGTVGASAAGDPSAPASSPAPAKRAAPVVPMLGGSADGGGKPMPVPVASASVAARTKAAKHVPVAPLRGLRQADLLVVAPYSLSGQVRAAVARQPGVTSVEPIEAAKIKINGAFTAVLGVNPSTFRGYASGATAASNRLWQGVANGGVAVSYTMGTLDRLSLGGQVTVAGQHQDQRLPVVAFGTVGIGGVDAVVSDSMARSLGVPAGNALVVSAPPAQVASLTGLIKKVLPRGAGVEALVTEVTRAGASSPVGTAPASGATSGAAVTATQLTAMLRAAESRRGLPYVWGAAGPKSFDCSGLVEWSFAQAGVTMPRVAADQARTGPAVPVSQLEPGDLLFYHTDPTDPGYISHVAIYVGNGWMIQAPQPGMSVEIVPASFSAQFAGAVRVYPRIAAQIAAGLA